MKTLYCFGDSWGYGSELDFSQGERPFADLVSEKLGYSLKNYSQSNMSLGLITRQISQIAKNINKGDLVLVVIPPDSRWYTEWQTLDYKKNDFFNDKSNEWFEYHHQLFIFAICEILNKTDCYYLLMHNYGKFPLGNDDYFFSNLYQEKFLGKESLTGILTDYHDTDSPIEIETRQGSFIFYGPYFEGCYRHPNQKGHEKIAELIEQKISKVTNELA